MQTIEEEAKIFAENREAKFHFHMTVVAIHLLYNRAVENILHFHLLQQPLI